MSAPAVLRALRRVAADTFRHALRSTTSGLMLAGTAACTAACLLVPVDGPGAGRALEMELAGWVTQAAAPLLALVLTAGMLPAFLKPHAASLLLAKPVPRPLLLLGKSAGVVAFVAVHASLLVGAAWLVLGLRCGRWDAAFLLCAPLLVLHFTAFFGFSAVLACATRNASACAFGTAAFWLLCWGLNFGHHAAAPALDAHHVSPAFGWAADAAYWALPKPLDFQRALAGGAGAPASSLLASALCGAAMLGLAAYDFAAAEY